MTEIIAKLRRLSEMTPSRTLHGRIMRRIFLINFRPHLVWLAGLMALNLGVSAWHFIDRAQALATFSVIQTLADNFELNMDFAANSIQMLHDSLPVGSALTLAMNAILTIYIVRLILRVRNAAPKLG